jgi:hypothetical protein
MSSIRTITTLGAPSGALTSNRGGAVAFRASNSVAGGYEGSAMGRIVRSIPFGAPAEVSASSGLLQAMNVAIATARAVLATAEIVLLKVMFTKNSLDG